MVPYGGERPIRDSVTGNANSGLALVGASHVRSIVRGQDRWLTGAQGWRLAGPDKTVDTYGCYDDGKCPQS